jgi:type II secretory pathway pseudopilin PulG
MKSNFKEKKGFTLIEMLLYIAILVFLLIVIINLLFNIVRSQKNFASSRSIENSSGFALERLAREIKEADSVNTGSSVFNSSPGTLTLNSTDINGTARTVQFYISSSTLHIKENGVDKGPLTQSDTRITNLVFYNLVTTNSKAIKTNFTIESGTSSSYRTDSFYLTAVLRGSL